jgi:hypothetical protein
MDNDKKPGRSSDRAEVLSYLKAGTWYWILCGVAGLWAAGFLAYAIALLIDWGADDWRLHDGFGKVIGIVFVLMLAAAGTAVSVWAYLVAVPPRASREDRRADRVD